MINMISVREGKVIDFKDYLIIAVKEEERKSCTGCYFSKISCSGIINCPSNKLIFKRINSNMKVKCIKEFATKHTTFRVNEEYDAQKVNESWYCVEAVGISNDNFHNHFELEKGGL